jgi:hypothetical protein
VFTSAHETRDYLHGPIEVLEPGVVGCASSLGTAGNSSWPLPPAFRDARPSWSPHGSSPVQAATWPWPGCRSRAACLRSFSR